MKLTREPRLQKKPADSGDRKTAKAMNVRAGGANPIGTYGTAD